MTEGFQYLNKRFSSGSDTIFTVFAAGQCSDKLASRITLFNFSSTHFYPFNKSYNTEGRKQVEGH